MTRREATRRFCGDCKKHVNDLSMMTETEARELLASPTTEGLCIRYLADEKGQLAFLPDVPVSGLTRLKRAALAAATLAAPLSLAACMGAAPQPEPRFETMGAVAIPQPTPSTSVPLAPSNSAPVAPSAAPSASSNWVAPVPQPPPNQPVIKVP